ncbi:hypothetical protein [Paenibacillus naphthalenovorans]|uniref:hypothetical protein n=1 Tax=Paenibacillus naphthalenovorans TaxID=162209 RepID=UPI000943C862|nr:hypothetical protein [Paenibacillus naphthalenovorans]
MNLKIPLFVRDFSTIIASFLSVRERDRTVSAQGHPDWAKSQLIRRSMPLTVRPGKRLHTPMALAKVL